MQYMNKGSNISFSKVKLSRKFHPPLRSSPKNTVQAEYSYDDKTITLFLPGLVKTGYSKDNTGTHLEIARIFVHETLHGVIRYICDKDKIDIYSYDEHWPMNNGLLQ